MSKYKGYYIFMGMALAALLLFLSACAPTTSTTGNGNSSLTVLQVLQNSTNAMQKLKSVHFETTTTGSVQGTYTATPATATPPSSTTTFNLKGGGDQLMPDQESAHITLNQSINLAEIVTADKVYIQNQKGQWYVLDKSKMQSYTGNPFTGINPPDTKTWLMLLQHVKITDHGDQSLNGQSLRHITATLDKDSLKQLLESNPQWTNLLGKDNIDAAFNATRSLTGTLDVWIDETQFYVHRTELKFNMNTDLSSLNTPVATATVTLPSNATIAFDSIVDLSKFNEPVTITPPANAIPTDNPVTIFQG